MARLDTILDKIDLVCVGQEKIDAASNPDQQQITNSTTNVKKLQQQYDDL